MSWNDFWGMNPHILKVLIKGYKEKLKEDDYLAWHFNQYTLSAVTVAVDRCLNGNKARAEYIKRPIMSDHEESESGYTESNEEVAVYEMKQRTKMLENIGLPESPS